ncbi:class I SAM-dependent methyltransferase [Rhodospirillum sp. A1_3_36]|uniref:class I SAM-dependent methyltransferase n=1 Tax=Rhodospirillum sp. A1_3_36 TaxID=3391666 RepID=UPI0039A436FF
MTGSNPGPETFSVARFDAKRALAYDDTVARAIPGYATLHDVIAAVTASLLPQEARILVVGAGTGAEILRLGIHQPGWSFLGLDPAEDMLAVARERLTLAEGGLIDRVDLMAGTLEDLSCAPPSPFDAALCVLVSHFLPDTVEGKAALFAGIAALVKPGAPLILADFLPPEPPLPGAELMEAAWVAWQRDRQIPEEAITRGLAHARAKTHPVGPKRLGTLLEGAGFAAPQRLFQALHVHGWLSFRKDSA